MKVNGKVPMRQCIGCREMKSKKELIRVLRTTEGEILVDLTGKKNGRGAYVCPDPACLEKAIKSRGLERSFKAPIPPEIYEKLREAFDRFDKQG